MYDLLKGVRVVEGAAFVAAPSCGLYLAQLGAEVIRFEQRGGGPDFRRWPLGPTGSSFYWEGLNKGKKSVTIDLGRPEGRALAQRLAAAPGEQGGIFITNFPAESFLSYARLKTLRPDLICARVMGWDDGGPAVDYTVNAATGLPMMTGPAGTQDVVNHVLPAWDLLTGAYAAFTIAAALLSRRSSGEGREIRISLAAIAATSLANLGMLAETEAGASRGRNGNVLYGAFGRDFLLADGQRLMVVAITARQWAGLLEALGLTEDVKSLESRLQVSFAKDEGTRFSHGSELYPMFERAFAAQEIARLAPILDSLGVCWSIYQSIEAAAQDPRLFANEKLFQATRHASGETYKTPGPAAIIPGDVRHPPAAAPALGRDTKAVLSELLSMPDSELSQLEADGIIG